MTENLRCFLSLWLLYAKNDKNCTANKGNANKMHMEIQRGSIYNGLQRKRFIWGESIAGQQ